MGTRSVFLGSEKEATAEGECDDGLGLRMQQANQSFSFPRKKMMLMRHHHPYHEHLDEGGSGGGGNGGGGGSMICNTSNQVGCLSDIYDVVSAGAGPGCGAARTSTLYPFTTETSTFNSSGMAASLSVPFTAAQWQELERQTMIYKYMMASVPVPAELLLPITKPPSNVAPFHSNMRKGSLELGISSNSDPELWRCRRTDGKKWRCSRDVAPDQKYCERHSHKTRPRSRKPVELHPNFLNTTNNVTTKPCQNTQFLNQKDYQMCSFPSAAASAASYEQPRCLEWFMKGEPNTVASSNQEWQHMMRDSQVGVKRGTRQHCEGEQLNSYVGLRTGQGYQAQRLNDQCSLLLSTKLASFEGAVNPNRAQETRHFIDAWSPPERNTNMNEISSKCSVSSNGKLPLSSLTLTMSGGNETNEEDQHTQVDFGTRNSEQEYIGVLKPQWMSPVSWMSSPPGGPLAEALCLGIPSNAKAGSNVASPHGCSTNSTTTSRRSHGNGSQGLNFID